MTLKKMAAVIAIAVLPGTALATPTVTFQGEVTDQTCVVSINGETNSVVMLPTVSVSDFSSTLADGQTAGLTPFTVSISECLPPQSSLDVTTKFLGYDVDTNTGVLGNRATTDPAVGFGIQLTTSSDGTTPVFLSGQTSVPGLVLPAGESSTSHTFGAQYYVIDANSATPGKVTAVAEYTLSYF
jgi:major type 1 subunit fimbrin (pilin)